MKKSRVELPEDLVMEILCKLPVKSLIRFGSVCKYWCCCFRSSRFISKHYQNNLKNNNLNLLLRCRETSEVHDAPYLFHLSTQKDELFRVQHNIRLPVLDKSFHVNGPCHGLLCSHDRKQGKTALWNPSTRELKILPPSPSSLHHPRNHSVDCNLFSSTVGFGFDSKTRDYKLIQFVAFVDESPPKSIKFQIELYSLKSDSWKYISYRNHLFPSHHSSNDCDVDGFCYWIATKKKHPRDSFTLSFDFVQEKFSTLPFPKYTWPFYARLLELYGSLGLIVCNVPHRLTGEFFDMWVMKGGEWSKQFSIVESIPGFRVPLGFWKNGELFYQGRDDELLLFDPSTREVKKLGINACAYTMKLVTYVESLVPMDGRRRSEHDEVPVKRQRPRDASNGREKRRRDGSHI